MQYEISFLLKYMFNSGVLLSINTAFERFRILNFKKHLLSLNCDCAAVNNDAYGGLGVLIKKNAP